MTQPKMDIPGDELVSPGHMACAGCGGALAMRFVLKALGRRTIATIPAGCWAVFDGPFPHSSLRVPMYHTAFETTAALASGIRRGLAARGEKDITVLGWAGDGGTADIGMAALSGAAERNEDFLFVCYDNEAYMNTGIQRSSLTPLGAWTTTTPARSPKARHKKNMVEIMAAHRVPYAASASIAYPEDLIAKARKAKNIEGFRYLHVLAPCPAGWRTPPDMTVNLARLAVLARTFPLYEVDDGVRYRISMDPEPIPIGDYLKLQGRFGHLTDEMVRDLQKHVDREWGRLRSFEEMSVNVGRPN